MSTILFLVALVASIAAFLILLDGFADGEPMEILFVFIVLIMAVAAWFGTAHFNHVEHTTWSGDDSVVYTVMTAEDSTFLITSGGKLLHCEVPAQCTPLVKGDHVTYQRLRDGKITLPDGRTRIPDIKDVKKG